MWLYELIKVGRRVIIYELMDKWKESDYLSLLKLEEVWLYENIKVGKWETIWANKHFVRERLYTLINSWKESNYMS